MRRLTVPSAARQLPTHWKAATRHSCRNRPPCRRFSSTFVSNLWRNRPRRRSRSRTMNTHEFEDRLEAMRTNPDMVAHFPKIPALAAFDTFADDLLYTHHACCPRTPNEQPDP